MRKLEVGSGNRPRPGYEHLDIDPRCPDVQYVCSMDEIPVDDNSFDEVLSVHVIEHMSWRAGKKIVGEWYRVLAPRGKLHLETPNLKWIAKQYLANNKVWYEDYKAMHPDERKHLKCKDFTCHVLWANFKLYSSGSGGDNHYACYDSFLLTHLLDEAGFKTINVLNDDDTLVVEAIK